MRDYIDFLQIKNIGEGNKFALNHDGSVVPSAGEMIWRQSLAKTRSKEHYRRIAKDRWKAHREQRENKR